MNLHVAALASGAREDQQTLLEHRQQDVVGFGFRARELVVNQRVTVLAGDGQALVDPRRHTLLVDFQHAVNEVIDDLAAAKTLVAAEQIARAELVVPGQQHNRATALRGHMQRQRGLARAARAFEVHAETRL